MAQAIPSAGAGRSVRYSAERREHAFDVSFEAFSHALESLFELQGPESSADSAPASLAEFALLYKADHGPTLGVTYVFKNPLLGPRMKHREHRAGLYLALRLYVGALDSRQTLVTYDVPSSVFAQFASPEVDAFATLLDAKLYALVLDAVELAGRERQD